MKRTAGFTLLELMLATAVASVIVLTTVGLMGFMQRVDQRLASQYEDVSELGRARETVRRAMISLLGAQPPEQDVTSRRAGRRSELARERFGDESLRERMGFEDGEKPPPTFEFGFTEPGNRGDNAPKMLDLRLRQSPIVGAGSERPVVRGAFELVPYPMEPYASRDGEMSWALLWTPLDPPGSPVVLARALEFADWRILDNDMVWRQEYEAHNVDDFPRALRIEMKTRAGVEVDWIFEPVVEVRAGL